MTRCTFVLVGVLAVSPSVPHAQDPNPIDASRRITWTPGVQGGIPDAGWAQCMTAACNTVTSNGCGATASQINAAIASAPVPPAPPTYVLLPGTSGSPCTFTFSSAINIQRSNVVLRGGGPDATKFTPTDNAGNVCLHPVNFCISDGAGIYAGNPGHAADWTAGYSVGTTQITLSSTTGLGVGSVILLDELDDGDADHPVDLWDCSTWWAMNGNPGCSTEGNAGVERSAVADAQTLGTFQTTPAGNSTIVYFPNGHGLSNTNTNILTFSATGVAALDYPAGPFTATIDDANHLRVPVSTGAACNPCNGGVGVHASGGRSHVEVKTVTAINGSTVTITPGIETPNFSGGRTPQAWWGTNASISSVGIENLSIDNSNSPNICTPPNTGGPCWGTEINGTVDWWIENVRSLNSNRAQILAYATGRGTIRDSYFWGTQNGQTQSYGIEIDETCDTLVENNIFAHIATPLPGGEGTCGTVYGYNYAIDDYFTGDPAGWSPNWMQGHTYQHSAANYFNLFEGNEGPGFQSDDIHGHSFFATLFRNHIIGWDKYGGATVEAMGKTLNTNAITIQDGNRFFNVVGNILGRTGTHVNYEDFPTSASMLGPKDYGGGTFHVSQNIYSLGWSGNEQKYDTSHGDSGNLDNDTSVRTTLLRWGNWDIVNNSSCNPQPSCGVQWNSLEVPSGIANYRNSIPSTHTLPASEYLSAQPPFWGTQPWPPIGPDVTGGTVGDAGNMVYKIPARACFESLSDDPAYSFSITSVVTGSTTTVNVSAPLPGNFQATPSTNLVNISGIVLSAGSINGLHAATAATVGATSFTVPVNTTGATVTTGTGKAGTVRTFNWNTCSHG